MLFPVFQCQNVCQLVRPLSIINKMFGLYVISFEVLVTVLYGVFLRITSEDLANVSYLSQSFLFLLGYILITIRYKLYDWTTLINLIFVSAISFQWCTLFSIFWNSCLNSSFASTSDITIEVMMVSAQATFCILLTIHSFLGKMTYLQIFVIALVQIVGFSLNVSVENLGLKAVMGGGGMTIFLFAAVFTFCIKLINYKPFKIVDDASYVSGIFKIIGLLFLVFFWPNFNSMGSYLDLITPGVVDKGANLVTTSYFNTVLALSSGIVSSLTLQSYGNRINLQKLIQNIFNSGVLISNCAGVIIDPFASLLLGISAPLITLLYEKYGQVLFFRGEPELLLVFSALSGLLSAVFVAGRAARTPMLTEHPHQLGGLQVACLIVTVGFAAVFGCLTALLLKLFDGPRDTEVGSDGALWILTSDIVTLHPDNELVNQSLSLVREKEAKDTMQFEERVSKSKLPTILPS